MLTHDIPFDHMT